MTKRFFWFCAGADKEILERSPYSEHVRYASLGGIVLATGIMAGSAGAFGFYTVFKSVLGAGIFGFLWGLMIFNLDRFIVSSSGKGDGTDAITWGELKSALPRLILALLLGLIISKPLELKIFEPEINSKLQELQLKESQRRKELTESIFNADIDSTYSKIDVLKAEIKDKYEKRDELSKRLQDEIAGAVSGRPGAGPASKRVEEALGRLQQELTQLETQNNEEIAELKEYIKERKEKRQQSLDTNDAAIASLDGLIIRMQLLHEIAPTISWVITFLFLAIETCPIFFKMMLTIGPFDKVKKEREELIMYKAQVEVEAQEAEIKATHEKILQAQEEIADLIISKWKAEQIKKVESNPEAFYDTIEKQMKK